MTNHTFLGGMGLGILAGAAMGMAVTAKGMQNPKMRRMAKKATQKMEQMKDDLADTRASRIQAEKKPPDGLLFCCNCSVELPDQLHAAVDAQGTAVEGEIIVLSVAPLHVGIEPVVGRPAFVLLFQPLLRGGLPLAVHLHDPLGTEVHIGVDKHPQAVGLAPEDIVGTPAHNDAGLLLRQFGDDPALDLPEIVLVGGTCGTVGKGGGQYPAGAYSPASLI